jgi:hypothetical protein
VTLGNLPVDLAGEESITQLLEPINHVFGKAALVVAKRSLVFRSEPKVAKFPAPK